MSNCSHSGIFFLASMLRGQASSSAQWPKPSHLKHWEPDLLMNLPGPLFLLGPAKPRRCWFGCCTWACGILLELPEL